MAPRTVAALTPLYFDERSCLGGGERYPLNLARGVVAAAGGSYRVELISFGDAPRTLELAPGVRLRVLPMAGRPELALDVVSWELPAALAGADLVHIHQAYTRCSEVGLLVARQQHKPICVTDHGGFSSWAGIEAGALDLADRIIAQSAFAVGLFRPTRTPITIIKGGVDADRFTPPDRPIDRDRIVYVGRLLPHKGIDRLIAALPPDLPLTVCGRPYHEDYADQLRHLAAGKRVEFIHDADDETIIQQYRRAWACVLPSVYRDCYGTTYPHPELMGFTLLEAMACGTPAICSRVGAMPEFVLDGETGFVFDDLDELTGRLRQLAADPGLVARLGRRAREVVEREYALEVAGSRLLDVYEELLARPLGSAARTAIDQSGGLC